MDSTISMTNDTAIGPQIDITGAKAVQVSIRNDGKVLWVNVDGILRLRVCQAEVILVEDARA